MSPNHSLAPPTDRLAKSRHSGQIIPRKRSQSTRTNPPTVQNSFRLRLSTRESTLYPQLNHATQDKRSQTRLRRRLEIFRRGTVGSERVARSNRERTFFAER